PHVPWVYRIDAILGKLRLEDSGELFERRLTGAVAAPAFVGLDRRVARDIEDARAWTQVVAHRLQDSQWGHHVDHVEISQGVERDVQQGGQGTGTKGARVVHHRVQPTYLMGQTGQDRPMRRVAHVAGQGVDTGAGRESGPRRL